MSESSPYPPPEARNRAVLVRNISRVATAAAIEEFFSFCGPVTSHRIRTVPPSAPGAEPTLEAVVIFADERVCADALVMDNSSIVDQPVKITRVPAGFNFAAPPDPPVQQQDPTFFSGGFSAFGDLFAGVGSAVAAEVDKAGKMIDNATETGVLKAAKDHVAMASQKTRDFAVDLDDKWHVRNNILNVAEVGKAKATEVATVVAEQTKTVAKEVDNRLHISENTGKLADRARENPTVNSGFMAFAGGWNSLLSQTGLAGQPPPVPSSSQPASHPAPPHDTSASRMQ